MGLMIPRLAVDADESNDRILQVRSVKAQGMIRRLEEL
jgi:hypothetical protein